MSDQQRGIDIESSKANHRPTGIQHLLIIGINSYTGKIPPLNNAKPDARAFRDVLCERYQFEPDHTVELYDADATRSNVYATLLQLAKQVQPVDSLLIYFAGHGEFLDTYDQGYWIPVDGVAGDYSSYLGFGELARQVEHIKAFHTLIIADSCYGGTMFSYRSVPSRVYQRLDGIPSRWLFTSGRNEVVPDGPKGTHSPFAEKLIGQLRYNQEPLVSIRQLSEEVIHLVAQGRNPIPRSEPLSMRGHQGGEFFFKLKGHQEQPQDTAHPAEAPVQEELRAPTARAEPSVQGAVVPETAARVPEHFESLRAFQQALQRLIMMDDLETTIRVLIDHIDFSSRFSNDVIMLSARLNQYKDSKRSGTLSQENLNITRNQIRHAILETLKDIASDDLSADTLQ